MINKELLTTNGRGMKLSNGMFMSLHDTFEKASCAEKVFLKQYLFKDLDDEILNAENKQLLADIKKYVYPHPVMNYIKNKINEISNKRLKDVKIGDEEELEVYKELLEFAESETLDWMITRMGWWMNESRAFYRGQSRDRIASHLFRKFELSKEHEYS